MAFLRNRHTHERREKKQSSKKRDRNILLKLKIWDNKKHRQQSDERGRELHKGRKAGFVDYTGTAQYEMPQDYVKEYTKQGAKG